MAQISEQFFIQTTGEGPLVALAVHDGHEVRPEVRDILLVDEEVRRREEDPFTAQWAEIAPTRFIGQRSRFEVDLNRPRERAVYKTPEDAWGLEVWKEEPHEELIERTLRHYDAFYSALSESLVAREREHGGFVLYDLHSYNHRREGPDGPEAETESNPQVIVGTGVMDRKYWAPVVNAFIKALRDYDFPGGKLDVRENVKFRGGNVSNWTNETFPKTGCALAIEFKKFFMDEWTGVPNLETIDAIRKALASTVEPLLKALKKVRSREDAVVSARTPRSRRAIRIGFVVNDVGTEQAGYTTIRLALTARSMGHDVWLMGVGDLAYGADEKIRATARSVPKQVYKNGEAFLRDLLGKNGIQERICVEDLDVLMLRNDPAPDSVSRPWAAQAGILFARLASKGGTLVLNDPDGLGNASSKIYFQEFPEEVRPKAIITRDRAEIKAFAKDMGGMIVLKPLQGSGGQSVFLIRPDDLPNINQMIDAVSRDGFVIAQEYLPAAEQGDTRLFLMNGEPLCCKGRYAAFRRVRRGGDMRSNIHAGGRLARAEIGQQALEIVEIVRPKLIEDGMFLVGLDIVGDKLMEINVFSPGGLGSAQKLEGVNFTGEVIKALERKAMAMDYYKRQFKNVSMATH